MTVSYPVTVPFFQTWPTLPSWLSCPPNCPYPALPCTPSPSVSTTLPSPSFLPALPPPQLPPLCPPPTGCLPSIHHRARFLGGRAANRRVFSNLPWDGGGGGVRYITAATWLWALVGLVRGVRINMGMKASVLKNSVLVKLRYYFGIVH